jgi:hypothetical protein
MDSNSDKPITKAKPGYLSSNTFVRGRRSLMAALACMLLFRGAQTQVLL